MLGDTLLAYAWLVPLFPALGFVLISFCLRSKGRLSAWVAVFLSLLSLLLSVGIARSVLVLGITMEAPFIERMIWFKAGTLQAEMGVLVDPLSALLLLVVTTVSLLVQIYSLGYMKRDANQARFFAFLSLFAAAMLGLVLAVNFLEMYVFWELVGLCSYLLIGFYYERIAAREAAKKAFLTTRAGDFGLLLGILLLQVHFGTLDFQVLQDLVSAAVQLGESGFLTLAAVLIFFGPIGKSGQFPLHVWLPDAMEGPTPVSALIHAATMVIAGVYLVARAFFLFAAVPSVLTGIAWLGAFTAFFAASIAVTQRPIKRILAYSTISQLGYMMLALGTGAVAASLFHLLTHAFFKALLFLCAGAVMHALGEEADIFHMGGLRKKLPVTFVTMTVGVLAIAGLPPFAGFFSKDAILLSAAAVSLPLYVLASVTSFLTAFYMARLLFVVFFGETTFVACKAKRVSWHMHFAMLVLAVFSAGSGMLGQWADFTRWFPAGPALEMGRSAEMLIAGISSLLALLAIGMAWLIYGAKCWSAQVLAARFGRLYTWSFHKYYVDECYAYVIRLLVDGAGRFFYWLDLYVVDGVVNWLARFTDRCGSRLAGRESGQVQQYAAVLFCGVLLLTLYGVFYARWFGLYAGGVF